MLLGEWRKTLQPVVYVCNGSKERLPVCECPYINPSPSKQDIIRKTKATQFNRLLGFVKLQPNRIRNAAKKTVASVIHICRSIGA